MEQVARARKETKPAPAPQVVSRPAGSFAPPAALRRNEPIQLALPANRPQQPPVKESESGQVQVSEGDSLWKIASRHLGSGNQWVKIAAVNPDLSDPNRLQVGQWLRLPGREASVAANQVSVQDGDSLWKVAQAQLGSGQAWNCIAAANPQIQDANRIYPGQVLTIPSSCKMAI